MVDDRLNTTYTGYTIFIKQIFKKIIFLFLNFIIFLILKTPILRVDFDNFLCQQYSDLMKFILWLIKLFIIWFNKNVLKMFINQWYFSGFPSFQTIITQSLISEIGR